MKKFLITAFTLLISLGVMAQAANDHTLRLYYGGEVIFSRLLSQLDSINFKVNTVEEDKPVVPDISTCDKKYSQEGLYLGIIGFNNKLKEREIGLLNPNTINSYKTFVNNLSVGNATYLYYAEENALNRLTHSSFPENLTSVSVVTFTDGLDDGSLGMNEYYEFLDNGEAQYLSDLNESILYDKVCGSEKGIDAYVIGLKGKDILDMTTFRNNLQKLSSDEQKVYEAENMEDVNETFNEIARSLYKSNITHNVTLAINTKNNGTNLRFTFDEFDDIKDSEYFIEGVYRSRNLESIKVSDKCLYGGTSVVNGVKNAEGKIEFTFQGLSDINSNPLPLDNVQCFQYLPNQDAWQRMSEFEDSTNVNITEEQKTAVVMLVLDCSSSLGDDFTKMQSAANNFISLLLNASEQNNTVSFNANGGTGTMSDMTYEKGQTKALIANKFTRAGYIFKGWNTKSDGTGTQYTDKQSLTPTENITLYAQWEEIPTLTISFIANGGSGSMQSVSVVKGTSTYLPDVTFTRAGYKFIGWNTNADGTGTTYTNKQSISLAGNLILYAQWMQAESKLYFVNSGGWEDVYAYIWLTGGEGINVWPGVPAYKESFKIQGYEVYSYDMNGMEEYQKIIFNDYKGVQTHDLEIDYSTPYYFFATGSWYSSKDEIPVIITTGISNGHEWVDLGLPSGTKWATTNVGASTPEGYGNYYAWGETSPKSSYTSSNYTYTGTPTTLPLSNDVANVMWGGNWRMPTKAEQDELRTECTWTWITQNGVNGFKITSRINGKSIFLPAAGCYYRPGLLDVGSGGTYWSSSVDLLYGKDAYRMTFYSGGMSGDDSTDCSYGRSVRPVLR